MSAAWAACTSLTAEESKKNAVRIIEPHIGRGVLSQARPPCFAAGDLDKSNNFLNDRRRRRRMLCIYTVVIVAIIMRQGRVSEATESVFCL